MAQISTTDTSPLGVLRTIPGWDRLDKKDQAAVEKETKALSDTLVNYGRSKLAIGEHLMNVQEKLPRMMFSQYLRAYHWKKSTAYGHIKGFKNAKAWLPEPVLVRVMERNMSMIGVTEDKPLGVYTDAIKRIPPPTTNDPKKINDYLDSVETAKKRVDGRAKKMQAIEDDPEVLLKQSYRFVSSRLKKINSRGRGRRQFVEALFGMLLSELGVSSGQTFEPQAVPDGFKAEVGRPRLVA